MPWILLLLLSLFSAPSIAVAIPGVTTGTSTAQQKRLHRNRMQKRKSRLQCPCRCAGKRHLQARVSRSAEKNCRHTAPGARSNHHPAAGRRAKTVLENVTEVSRHYADALSSRFAQLYRNLMGSSHKPFNPRTFTAAATQFLLLASAVFIFTGWCACARGPCTEKWGNGVARRISRKAAGCICR